MIHREGQVTRVERVEWRMRVEVGVGVFFTLVLAVYFLPLLRRPVGFLVVGALIVLAVVLLVTGIRRRPVLVIEPARVGCGFLGGKTWWYDRDRIGAVVVRKRPAAAVRLYDRSDKLLASHVFAYFDPKELSQASKSVGIPVR